jgi:hypothetical protein
MTPPVLNVLKSDWGPWPIFLRLMPSWHKLITGRINLIWLSVWVSSPDWLSHKGDFCQALRWSRRAWGGGGECAPCHVFASYCRSLLMDLGTPHPLPQCGWTNQNWDSQFYELPDIFPRLDVSKVFWNIVTFLWFISFMLIHTTKSNTSIVKLAPPPPNPPHPQSVNCIV